jgi:purine-cytosine permease-like protein
MLLGLVGVIIFIVSFVATTGITVWFVVKLPADYFVNDGQRKSEQRASVSDWVRFLLRNLLAVALVGLGIILSLPGIPGQGVLTILLGVMISDFPGKERLERKIVSYPKVLEALNRLRERFGKPPLQT